MKNRFKLGFMLSLIVMVLSFGFIPSFAAVDEQMFNTLSERVISADDVAGSSKQDLRILRNSIFAQHGLIFKSNDLKKYFSKYPWYKARYSNVDKKLSSIEKQNVALLKSMENGKIAIPAAKKSSASENQTANESGKIPEECINAEGNYVGDEACAGLMNMAGGDTSTVKGGSETSSKLPDEVVQGLWIAFGLFLLFTFIMGATDSRVVFFNLLDFLLSLLAFVCIFGSQGVINTEYSWAEIPLLVIGILLFVRIIGASILNNRSIVWGLIMSPLKIIVSVSIVLYPMLWIMEKFNKHQSFHYSESDSRTLLEQRRDFIRGKKFWSAILLALLALLIWICKKCLNGERVYAKRGWAKDDGWNYKMLIGKGQPEETPAEEN